MKKNSLLLQLSMALCMFTSLQGTAFTEMATGLVRNAPAAFRQFSALATHPTVYATCGVVSGLVGGLSLQLNMNGAQAINFRSKPWPVRYMAMFSITALAPFSIWMAHVQTDRRVHMATKQQAALIVPTSTAQLQPTLSTTTSSKAEDSTPTLSSNGPILDKKATT